MNDDQVCEDRNRLGTTPFQDNQLELLPQKKPYIVLE